jgi:hypothetical protein
MSDQGEPIGQEREQKQYACLVFRLISNCRRNTFEACHLPVLRVGFPPPLDLGQRSGARKERSEPPTQAGHDRYGVQAPWIHPGCLPIRFGLQWSWNSPGRLLNAAAVWAAGRCALAALPAPILCSRVAVAECVITPATDGAAPACPVEPLLRRFNFRLPVYRPPLQEVFRYEVQTSPEGNL